MRFLAFVQRLQKKALFESLNQQIKEAERIGKKMDVYRTTLDGEADWFERVCREKLDDVEQKKKRTKPNGTCTNSPACDSAP